MLEGKVAFVTGAASGIGRATAVVLAQAGLKLALVDTNVEGLEETAHLIGDAGRCATMRADLCCAEDVAAAVDKTIQIFGALDFAHNNAGIFGTSAPVCDYPPEIFVSVIQSNVFSVFLCMRAQLRHMLGRKSGVIVNTASAAGLRASRNISAYIASKHAVIGLTRAAALEYAEHGIRINALCPGFVHTPLTAELSAEAIEGIIQATPARRTAQPEEMGRAVRWLFSDDGAYMTGSNFVMDGGFSLE